jgi:ATP-binding cassette, subfamily G (WHITE), eye pigment precursor transporter
MSVQPSSFNFSAELEWEELTVVTSPTRSSPSRTLLKDCKGLVRPGEFLAIMGPTGAGKTTLLNCLSSKFQKGLSTRSGRITLNGRPISSLNYKAMIGFVPQDDILLESMTPRESIDFSAALTLDLDLEGRKSVVDRILEHLSLTTCADTVIGGKQFRGISVGERKRTSIGVETVFNPSVLFLDEPTTGSDSFTALSLVNLLVEMAKGKNCTIIATIHQPSSQIFSKFDKLLLLTLGSTIFTGKAGQVHTFFKDAGFPIKENYNPADHFMAVLSREEFESEDFRDTVRGRVIHRPSSGFADLADEPKPHYQVSSFTALLLLLKRAFTVNRRNPVIARAKVLKMLITAGLCAMTFANLGTSSSDMHDRFSAVFMLSNSVVMESLMSTVSTFQLQKPVFLREFFGRKYGVVPLFVSYSISVLVLDLIYTIGLYSISYFIMELNPRVDRFFTLLTIGALASISSSGFGLFISIVAPTLEIASALTPIVMLPFMLTSGFMVSYNNIPNWFVFQYISPFRFTFEASVRTDIEHNPNISHDTSKQAIESLKMPDSYTQSFLYLIAMIAAVRLIAIISMKLLNRNI